MKAKPKAQKKARVEVDDWLDDGGSDSGEEEKEEDIEEEKTGDRQILYQVLNVQASATQEEIVKTQQFFSPINPVF